MSDTLKSVMGILLVVYLGLSVLGKFMLVNTIGVVAITAALPLIMFLEICDVLSASCSYLSEKIQTKNKLNKRA